LADFNKAIELKPDYAEGYFDRGRLKQNTGNLDGSLADLSKSIELNPLFIAYFARGRTQQIGGNLDGALADFNKTIEVNPNFSGAYYFRGCLFYDQHAFTKASVDFEKVCALNSPSDYAHFRLWLIRARLGQKEDATKQLQAYLSLRQTGPPAGWLAKVSGFLTGQLSEADFLKAAQEGDQKTSDALAREAYFFAGTTRLIGGDTATAREYFGKCVATAVKEDPSYQSAAAELKFLPAGK
jgi:lipoprotein NlpI